MKVLNATFLILKVENDNVVPSKFEIGSTDRILLNKNGVEGLHTITFYLFLRGFLGIICTWKGFSFMELSTYIHCLIKDFRVC